MPYTAKVSSPGISVDTNNDGTINGRIHRIKNAGNFNTFTIANGVLTVEGPTGGSAIGGADTQVQFNDGGSSLAGHSGMVYDKTFSTNAGKLTVANLVISGDLTVSGTTTTINTTNVSLADNIIVLNSDATGSASADAGIEIERGDDANVQFMWDESEDSWDFDTYNLASVGRIYAAGSSTPVYSFTSDTNTGIEHAAADAMGLMVNGIRRVHVGVNGMSIVGLDGTTAAGAAGTNQALLVDNISIDDQTIATIGSNKNLILHPHGSGAVELAGVSSNQTALFTTASAHDVVGTGVTIQAGSTTAGTTNDIAGGSLTLKAGAGKGTGAGGNIVFQTANQAGSGGSSINAHATALTIQDDLSAQFTGNVSIAGGLTVTGTTTSVNTTNTAVADQLLVINDGEAQNGVDNGSGESGLEVDRGTDGGGSPNDHAFFVFNESIDTWVAKIGTAMTNIGARGLTLGTAGELQITESSDNIIYQNTVSDKMHIFQTNFGGSAGETFLTVGGTIKGINVGNMDIVHESSDTVLTNKTADKDIIFLTAPFTDSTCDTDTSAGSGGFGSNPRIIQMDSTAKLRAGMTVTGTGVSGTIVSVDSATLFTLSADVTATNSDERLTFTPNNASANLIIDGSTQRVGIGTGTPATNLTVEGTVTLKEQAAAEADTAAYGQLWVKTATPNELYFTTDAGDDIQLTSGTGIAATDTNTQTTYTPSVVDSSDDALIRLTASGAGSGTQDVKLVAGTNITLTPDATTTPHQITIAASGGGTVDVVSNVATSRVLGRVTGSSGDSEELTAAQVRTLINVADGATANTAGIASGNVATFTSGVADNDFLKVAGTVIEGRSAAETLSDIGGVDAAGAVTAVQSASSITLAQGATFLATTSVLGAPSGHTTHGTTFELLPTDRGKVLLCDASFTVVGLPDIGSNTAGDTYVIINTSGSGITIDRTGLASIGGHGGGQALNGASSNGTLASHEAVTLICVTPDTWYGIGL